MLYGRGIQAHLHKLVETFHFLNYKHVFWCQTLKLCLKINGVGIFKNFYSSSLELGQWPVPFPN
jgi:hypothetical protein